VLNLDVVMSVFLSYVLTLHSLMTIIKIATKKDLIK